MTLTEFVLRCLSSAKIKIVQPKSDDLETLPPLASCERSKRLNEKPEHNP